MADDKDTKPKTESGMASKLKKLDPSQVSASRLFQWIGAIVVLFFTGKGVISARSAKTFDPQVSAERDRRSLNRWSKIHWIWGGVEKRVKKCWGYVKTHDGAAATVIDRGADKLHKIAVRTRAERQSFSLISPPWRTAGWKLVFKKREGDTIRSFHFERVQVTVPAEPAVDAPEVANA